MITDKQAAVLQKILRAGGAIRLHSGNVAKRGGAHKAQIRALVALGLVEESMFAPIPPAVVGHRITNVTAKGCIALDAYLKMLDPRESSK